MVDRVYKGAIPEFRKALENLRTEFSRREFPTDWVRLRVEPVLRHARELERLVTSREFAGEFSRLRRGVSLFHSDLVYLRTNVKELERLLQAGKRSRPR